MNDDVRNQIRRGGALLDEKEPGWRDRIAPGDLNLKDCHACVLGQLFGDYGLGKQRLGIDWGWPYGFDAGTGRYRESTKLWIGYIKGEWS